MKTPVNRSGHEDDVRGGGKDRRRGRVYPLLFSYIYLPFLFCP
jgi:hypothetical protein